MFGNIHAKYNFCEAVFYSQDFLSFTRSTFNIRSLHFFSILYFLKVQQDTVLIGFPSHDTNR